MISNSADYICEYLIKRQKGRKGEAVGEGGGGGAVVVAVAQLFSDMAF